MLDLGEQVRRWSRGRTCLLGVGDVGQGDDGFGVRLAQAVAARLRSPRAGGSAPRVIDAGTEPERHLLALADGTLDDVVFLDAVEFGAPPGTALLADAAEIGSRLPQISTHRISLGVLARCIEERRRTRAWLLGVQPESLAPGRSLAPRVQAALDLLADVLSAPWETDDARGDVPAAEAGVAGVSA